MPKDDVTAEPQPEKFHAECHKDLNPPRVLVEVSRAENASVHWVDGKSAFGATVHWRKADGSYEASGVAVPIETDEVREAIRVLTRAALAKAE